MQNNSLLFSVKWKGQEPTTWESSYIIGGSAIYARYVAQRAQALRATGKDGDSRDAKIDERAKLLEKLDKTPMACWARSSKA